MTNSEDRGSYCDIRYYYYHAGRSLYMNSNFHAGGIMLGYAIETTLKAGLMEVLPAEQLCKNRILKKDHDVRKILAECRKYHIFNKGEVGVSRDFMNHINNVFQRYPSQTQKVMKNAMKEKYSICNSTKWINYYDDLIIQLDECLLKVTSDPSISIMHNAFKSLDNKLTREILKENAFALLKFDIYVSRVRQNMPNNEVLRNMINDSISKGQLFYWNTDISSKIDLTYMLNIAKFYKANSFTNPKWKLKNGHYEAEVGNFKITL